MSSTSFATLTRGHALRRIEVPIIQRDYAQGRADPETTRIRSAFLDVLHQALTGAKPIHLDFVYGSIEGDCLIPLDGQQRLTTLFLLHWYLGARCSADLRELPMLTYRTRLSARLFCEHLVEQHPFPLPAEVRLSDWLRDQSWFATVWRHDPTIASMLVVLDAIHQRFAADDCASAWQKLVRPGGAITFHFLELEKLWTDRRPLHQDELAR